MRCSVSSDSEMKEAGFNAIRMSHHPMAPAMLRACDEIGMYVMDETFDMWNRLNPTTIMDCISRNGGRKT